MKRKAPFRRYKIMLTVVSFFLLIAMISTFNSGINNFLTSFILTPVQRFVFQGAYDLTEEKDTDKLIEEVSRLKEENNRLNDMLVDYYDIKRQNEELNGFFGIKKADTTLSLVTAAVIGRDPNENFSGFTADKGSADGVSINSAVITEDGLVGQVCEVAPYSCKVTTILSPDISAGAEVKRTGSIGIISGSAAVSDDGYTMLVNIPAENKPAVDDIVVTAGYGGIFPKNIRIGKVKKLLSDSFTGMPSAVIEPFADIKTVRYVAIVTDFRGKM